MKVAISRGLLDQITAHAAQLPDEEVCGLLLGNGERIEAVRRAANVAADRRRLFELDPAVLLAAYRSARAGGPRVLGHYHSHPHGDPSPSPCDADNAVPGTLWLLIAGQRVALFEARQSGPIQGCFHALQLVCE